MSDAPRGVLRDFAAFLGESKAWWLVPLVVMLGLLVWLAWTTREPARPVTYPEFGFAPSRHRGEV